jgi:hypothetical protein
MTGKKNIDLIYDIVKEKDEIREKEIQREVLDRKQIRIRKDLERENTIKEMHEKYGYKVIEPHLISQGCRKVFHQDCAKCNMIKCFPYEFLTTDKKDNGKNHCTQCMKSASETVKKCTSKNNFKCGCGVSYYCTPLSQAKHENTIKHLNNIRQLKIFNGNIYKQNELRLICSLNSVKDYKGLTIDEMIEGILKVKDFKIPKELQSKKEETI